MKALQTAPTLLAVVAATWLIAPTPLLGFSILGHDLDLTQRDFRVFNNFQDAADDDNTRPDVQFPGYQGAVMAIWKASVEWGSALHGTGDGDPTQPGDLGSGDANFDPSFQGNATAVGSATDNIHSAATGLGPGILAFTEISSAGWRIRYNDDFIWDDGPGSPGVFEFDIQGVACHEYGHALGLGHSSVGGATMYPVVFATDTTQRSIEQDDINGVRYIYGTAAAGKPRVTSVFLDAANRVVIGGEGFDSFANEIWFTQAGAGGTGDPVKALGVASTAGGTLITVSLPAGAGSGDVLVKVPGTAHSTLSNAWPFDVMGAQPSCGIAQYGTGLGGSNIGTISSASSPSPGATVAIDIENFNGNGVLFTFISAVPAEIPSFGGTLVIAPGAVFQTLQTTVTSGVGTQLFVIPAAPALVGAHAHFQSGMVDPTLPSGVALSNGLSLVVCP